MSHEPLQDQDFPEHEKLTKVKDESQVIGAFIEWLQQNGVSLCRYEDEGFWPLRCDINSLLAEYYEIDLKKLENEKLQMLQIMRMGHAEEAAQ